MVAAAREAVEAEKAEAHKAKADAFFEKVKQEERYNDGAVRDVRSGMVVTPTQRAVGKAMTKLLKDAGIEVVTDVDEMRRVLAEMLSPEAKLDIEMMSAAKKNPYTLPARGQKSSPTIGEEIPRANVEITMTAMEIGRTLWQESLNQRTYDRATINGVASWAKATCGNTSCAAV